MKCYSGIFWGQVTGPVFNKTTVLVLLFVFLFLPHRLGHLYCDYSTPCRGGRGTMTEAVTTHCECRETTVSYQQLQRCRPCPEWRPPLSASCHFLSEGFGSSSQFLRCHRSVLKKNKTKQLGDERVNMNEDIMRTWVWEVQSRFFSDWEGSQFSNPCRWIKW